MSIQDIRAERLNEAIKASGLSYAELEKKNRLFKVIYTEICNRRNQKDTRRLY